MDNLVNGFKARAEVSLSYASCDCNANGTKMRKNCENNPKLKTEGNSTYMDVN